MPTIDLTPREIVTLRQIIAERERRLAADDADIELEALSDRESEILLLLASGYDGAQIATRCTITTSTVKTHIENIFSKLNARNARHAVAIALKTRLLAVEDFDL